MVCPHAFGWPTSSSPANASLCGAFELLVHHQGWAQQKPIPALHRECGLYSNPSGESIAHIDREASGWRGVLQLSFWHCPARLWRLLILKLAAAEGEQDGWTIAHLPSYL